MKKIPGASSGRIPGCLRQEASRKPNVIHWIAGSFSCHKGFDRFRWVEETCQFPCCTHGHIDQKFGHRFPAGGRIQIDQSGEHI